MQFTPVRCSSVVLPDVVVTLSPSDSRCEVPARWLVRSLNTRAVCRDVCPLLRRRSEPHRERVRRLALRSLRLGSPWCRSRSRPLCGSARFRALLRRRQYTLLSNLTTAVDVVAALTVPLIVIVPSCVRDSCSPLTTQIASEPRISAAAILEGIVEGIVCLIVAKVGYLSQNPARLTVAVLPDVFGGFCPVCPAWTASRMAHSPSSPLCLVDSTLVGPLRGWRPSDPLAPKTLSAITGLLEGQRVLDSDDRVQGCIGCSPLMYPDRCVHVLSVRFGRFHVYGRAACQ